MYGDKEAPCSFLLRSEAFSSLFSIDTLYDYRQNKPLGTSVLPRSTTFRLKIVNIVGYNYLMKTARANLFIEGRVQGVFYRAFTRNLASKLGINGWVRNLYDGRVEALFEGNRELIEQAIQECRRGPAGAVVRHIDVRWEESSGEYKSFEIRY